jgi:hypothetical protein
MLSLITSSRRRRLVRRRGEANLALPWRGALTPLQAPQKEGARGQLTDFKTDRILSFDWSRDGKWLACSRGVVNSDVVLISNLR